MKKFKKILMVSLFLLVLSSVVMGSAYAGSNEKLKEISFKETEIFNKKIVSINQVVEWNNKGDFKESYNINVKKDFLNQFKIKSIDYKYTDGDTGKTIFKTHDVKNKTTFTIKLPKNDRFESEVININYQTTSQTKKESVNLWKEKTNSIREFKYAGKKSNLILIQKGYDLSKGQGYGDITSHEFKIKTTDKKYKINTIKAMYSEMGNKIIKTVTIKGNGKTSLNKVLTRKTSVFEYIYFQVSYY